MVRPVVCFIHLAVVVVVLVVVVVVVVVAVLGQLRYCEARVMTLLFEKEL